MEEDFNGHGESPVTEREHFIERKSTARAIESSVERLKVSHRLTARYFFRMLPHAMSKGNFREAFRDTWSADG